MFDDLLVRQLARAGLSRRENHSFQFLRFLLVPLASLMRGPFATLVLFAITYLDLFRVGRCPPVQLHSIVRFDP